MVEIVSLRNVTKRFGRNIVLKNVSLEVEEGSLTTLLGPSGCGKTTTLRILAGFYDPDKGEVYIGQKKMNGVPPYKRSTSMVFQDYALFPHMTVLDNIAYGLKIRKTTEDEIRSNLKETMKLLNIEGLEERRVGQLSGGQQQRVALARALVVKPEVLLLDEPLSNLDAKLRLRVRHEIRSLQKSLGLTTVYVTHDQEEALSISDKVVLMKDGEKIQEGTPQQIYFQPASRFVADFVGTRNFLEGIVQRLGDSEAIISLGDQSIRAFSGHQLNAGEKITVCFRAESASISKNPTGENNQLRGKIRSKTFLGSIVQYLIDVGVGEVIVNVFEPVEIYDGDVFVTIRQDRLQILKS